MAFEELTLDPDLEEVLRDVANDPRARLFHVDPWRVTKGLIAGQLKPSRTGLTKAEDHLVSCYRRELAYLMRVGFLQWFLPGLGGNLWSAPIPSATQLRKRAAQSDVQGTARGLHVPLRRYFESAGTKMRREEAFSLLSHSLVLGDSPDGRCYLSLYYRTQGQHKTAATLAAVLAGEGYPPAVRAAASQCLAMSHAALGNNRSAICAYDAALAVSQRFDLPADILAMSLLSCLSLALAMGDETLLMERSRMTEDALAASPIAARSATQTLVRSGSPQAAWRAIPPKRVADRLGPLSREFIDAVTEAAS